MSNTVMGFLGYKCNYCFVCRVEDTKDLLLFFRTLRTFSERCEERRQTFQHFQVTSNRKQGIRSSTNYVWAQCAQFLSIEKWHQWLIMNVIVTFIKLQWLLHTNVLNSLQIDLIGCGTICPVGCGLVFRLLLLFVKFVFNLSLLSNAILAFLFL